LIGSLLKRSQSRTANAQVLSTKKEENIKNFIQKFQNISFAGDYDIQNSKSPLVQKVLSTGFAYTQSNCFGVFSFCTKF
jgi:hypothetical protein